MKKKKYKGKTLYELTNKECLKMLSAADKAFSNTYPISRSGFTVSVMTKNGNIYTGVSYISDTDTLTMHSEATALAHAAIHGEREIIAITGPNCHICKQLIYENSLRSGIDITVIIKDQGKIQQIPISYLMPYPWPDKIKQKKLSKKKQNKFKNIKF